MSKRGAVVNDSLMPDPPASVRIAVYHHVWLSWGFLSRNSVRILEQGSNMTSRGVIEYGLEEEDTKAGTLLIDQGIQSLGKEGLTWSIGR